VATTVKVTVCDCEDVVSEIVESLTVNELMEGAWVSVLVTVTLSCAVDRLPAASPTVAVTVSVVLPNE